MAEHADSVTVQILNGKYPIKCPQNKVEILVNAAEYLDKNMREIADSGTVKSFDRLMIIAALNITGKYLEEKKVAEKKVEDTMARIRRIMERIDDDL